MFKKNTGSGVEWIDIFFKAPDFKQLGSTYDWMTSNILEKAI